MIRRFSQMNADSKNRDPETYAVIGAAVSLRITQLSRALLINFGADPVESKRLVLSLKKSVSIWVNLRNPNET